MASWRPSLSLALFALVFGPGCISQDEAAVPDSGAIVPHYDRQTGRLKQLTTDRNADGKIDMWAYMDGPRLERIDIDRDGDEAVDRIEYYEARGTPDPALPFGGATIFRADELGGAERTVVRQEFFEGGVLQRVEEDLDADGRVDKWELHAAGRLARVDLDVEKRGTPDRRLTYGYNRVERIEVDPDGDGVFELAPVQPEAQR